MIEVLNIPWLIISEKLTYPDGLSLPPLLGWLLPNQAE